MQFNIKLAQNSNGYELINSSSSTGEYLQNNIALEADVSYYIDLSTVPLQWDTIGKYTIKLIKQ